MEAQMLLRDPEVYPSDKVLRDVLAMIKEEFAHAEPSGRLIPMIIDVKEKNRLMIYLLSLAFKKA
jgi:hypothetical protein